MARFDKFAMLYFELEDICKTAIDNITKAEQDAQRSLSYQRELLHDGEITEKGFKSEEARINSELKELKDSVSNSIKDVQARFNAAVDEYMLPTSDKYDKSTADMLVSIELTTEEFMAYARKYAGNPTMERVLAKYKADKGLEAYWLPENGETIKGDFDTLVMTLESDINLKDKEAVSAFISKHYHLLRCANPDHLKYEGNVTEPGMHLHTGGTVPRGTVLI